MNIGILLAAGTSSRFQSDVPKQLYKINDRSIIQHSMDAFDNMLDEIIIITNSNCHQEIKNNYPNTTVLINDINCRLQSIQTAINHIGNKDFFNIIIHDSARPFITIDHVQTLLESSKNYLYSQYFMKLTNGLAQKNQFGSYDIADRDNFIELCTPQIVNYPLFRFIFNKHINQHKRKNWEVLPIINHFEIKYNLIEGFSKHLRKITTIHDIY